MLESLEGANGAPKSKALCGVDFSKSFSRCSFQQILKAYQRLKAPQWIINMHAAFLKGRMMRGKVGNVLSDNVSITGGAVQGSILGVLDHNAVLEDIVEDLAQQTEKYVDDMTLFEAIPLTRPGVVGDGIVSTCAKKSQKSLEKIEEKPVLA